MVLSVVGGQTQSHGLCGGLLEGLEGFWKGDLVGWFGNCRCALIWMEFSVETCNYLTIPIGRRRIPLTVLWYYTVESILQTYRLASSDLSLDARPSISYVL